jgi:YD repeat-containing protein
MTDALGGTKTIVYDAAGNLIAETDELNRTSTFNYDALNRQVRDLPKNRVPTILERWK